MHGGEIVARALAAHGVRQVFTLIGGHVSPILVGCEAQGIRVVDVRHEVNTVFAADAVARMSGIPGVAVVTAGPGVTNTVTAIKNAQMAQSPVVLIGGAAATILKGRGSLQDIDQQTLLRSVVKWSTTVKRVRDLEPAIVRAFAEASSGVPGPVFVECPIDVLYPEATTRETFLAKAGGKSLPDRALGWYLRRHLDRLFAPGPDGAIEPTRVEPDEPDAGSVGRVVAALARSERPLLLVGSQALLEPAAVDALAAAIDRLGIPVYLAGAARGLLGRDHPLQARHRRRESLKRADLVLQAGVPSDFRLDYGRVVRRAATLVGVNRSRRDLRLNRRPSIGTVGDPGRFLRALSDRVTGAKRWQAWREEVAARDAEREADIAERAAVSGELINPLALCRQIEAHLDDDSVLVVDGGDFVATAAYICRPRGPLSWLDPGAFGTLGVGAGFAMGAAMARPDAEIWIVYGDGSVGFSIAEFDTFVRMGIPVIAVVGNDACWTQIVRDQVTLLGSDVACNLARSDYHEVAAGFGAVGFEVRELEHVEPVLAKAKELRREGRTVLINALIDRNDFRKGSLSV